MHDITRLTKQFYNLAGLGCWQINDGLGCFDGQNGLVFADFIALGDMPFNNFRFLQTFPQIRQFEVFHKPSRVVLAAAMISSLAGMYRCSCRGYGMVAS